MTGQRRCPQLSACAGCGHPSPWQRPLGALVSASAPAPAPHDWFEALHFLRPGASGCGRLERLLWRHPSLFPIFGNRSLYSRPQSTGLEPWLLQWALREKRLGRPRSERILLLFFERIFAGGGRRKGGSVRFIGKSNGRKFLLIFPTWTNIYCPIINIPHENYGCEPTLTQCNHQKSLVYCSVHSWCCAFCRFRQMYIDMYP